MDHGTDAGRDAGPVSDARPPAPRPGPPWRPWWAHCSSGRDVLRGFGWPAIATYWAVNGTVLTGYRPLDPVVVIAVVVFWIYSLIGVVVFWRRLDLARLPPRPWTRPAGICAAFAALLLEASFAVHLSATSSSAQWIAVVLALPAASLLVAAAALNHRADPAAPRHSGADIPGPPV